MHITTKPGGMIRLLTGVLACLMISFSSLLSFSPTSVTDLKCRAYTYSVCIYMISRIHYARVNVLIQTGYSNHVGSMLNVDIQCTCTCVSGKYYHPQHQESKFMHVAYTKNKCSCTCERTRWLSTDLKIIGN